MKKIFSIIAIMMIIGLQSMAMAEVGYVDYNYISKNYPLAQTYNTNLKNQAQSIKTYAQQKDAQIAKAKTKADKDKIKKEALEQVKIKQNELAQQKKNYESELIEKVKVASEKIRVLKKLDIIIKSDVRVTGGVDCTNDILYVLKTQN